MNAVPQLPPESLSSAATSLDRRIQMLRTAMGPLIAAALEDPDVVEIMLNPDRTLWVDRLSSGRAPLGVELSEADGERIIRLVAAYVGAEVHRGQPLLSAELPEAGERFEGILPPAAPGPACALRKHAVGVILTLPKCCYFLLVGNWTVQAKSPRTVGTLITDGIDSYPAPFVYAGRYRIWPTHVLPRKRNIKRARRDFRALAKRYEAGQVELAEVRQRVASFIAYSKHCAAHDTVAGILKELTLRRRGN